MSRPILYDYWRSSAAYRVRIALNLKGVEYESRQVDLRDDQQKAADYRALNPQGLVPMLEIDGHRLTQSLAIINYLDLRYPNQPLIPAMAADRAHVVILALMVACDIHPLNNLRVLKYLAGPLGHDEAAIAAWYNHWILEGFEALERIVAHDGQAGDFCHGDAPTLADICLVPQVVNARRYNLDMAAFPTVRKIFDNCLEIEAFRNAVPEEQPDFEP